MAIGQFSKSPIVSFHFQKEKEKNLDLVRSRVIKKPPKDSNLKTTTLSLLSLMSKLWRGRSMGDERTEERDKEVNLVGDELWNHD